MLGRAPGALLLRSDVIRKRLSNVLPEDRLPATAYGPEANAEVYETVRREASAALAGGQTVIVDAVFGTEAERRAVEGAAAGAPFFGIWLEAPGSTLVARVAQRVGDASDATPEVISRQMTMETGLIKWRRLDASSPPEAVLAAAIASLPGDIRATKP
jgi:predicted kinase